MLGMWWKQAFDPPANGRPSPARLRPPTLPSCRLSGLILACAAGLIGCTESPPASKNSNGSTTSASPVDASPPATQGATSSLQVNDGQQIVAPVDASVVEPAQSLDAERVKRMAVRVEQVRGVDVGCGVIVARGKDSLDVLTADHLLGTDGSAVASLATLATESYVIVCWEEVDGRLVRRVYKTADVVLRDPTRDLALLRTRTDKVVDKSIDKMVDKRADNSSISNTDQTVAELGSAGGVGVGNALNAKSFEAWGVRVSREEPAQLEKVRVVERLQAKRSQGDPPVSYWRLDKPIDKGMSGGPLLDDSGRLIGIASGVSAGAAYYVELGEIRQFLRGVR